MKKFKKFIFVFAAAVLAVQFSGNLFAQESNKIAPPDKIMYSTSSSTNDVNALTTVKPEEQKFDAHKQELLNRLETARITNNRIEKEAVESELNKLNGLVQVPLTEANDIHFEFMGNQPVGSDLDFNTSQIIGGGIWASATQTAASNFPVPGTIWVGLTQYSNSGTDTCKYYYSTNAGATWNYAYLFYFGSNMDFRNGEIDFELMYDGSVVWIYGVAGYTDIAAGNLTKSVLFRFNTTTNVFNGYFLTWPGTVTSSLYYNPRITSDNTVFTNLSYVMLGCSFDSTYNTNVHFNRQKYAYLTNPFTASPTITYASPGGNGGFWWNSNSVPANTYLWTDIAYFKTSGGQNRVFTTYNVPGSINYNIYLAWSDDYGSTLAGSSSISETSVDYGCRVAFNGVTGNTTGMIVYTRQFSGTDWDPYCRYTTDGGTTWVGSYVDGSSNRTRTVDIIAPRTITAMYKVAYAMDSTTGNYAAYTGGSPVAWTFPSRQLISPVSIDTTFTKVIAGFKLGGGDDCLGLFSSSNGANLYSSRLCLGTVGIEGNNNEIPSVYSLQQNYPNPFNPSTTIKFSLPLSGMVKLVVYDAAGKVVEELVNNELNAGNYEYSFNASQLASGVYFYKLTAGSFSEVKKMALIK